MPSGVSATPDGPAPTVIGALHPKMLKLAAEKTTGAHPYLVPPEHTAFARETMGKGAWICTEQKVVLETDASKARAAARASIAMYLELPNYRRSLKRFGITDDDFAAGGSDKLAPLPLDRASYQVDAPGARATAVKRAQ